MKHRRAGMAALLFLGLVSTDAAAQQPDGFELTVANIMRGPEHVGDAPSNIRWSDSGEWLFFRWTPGGQPWHQEPALYRVRARGGEPERLSDAAADSLGPLLASGDISSDERWRAVDSDGDLYLIDRRDDSVRRITETRDDESNPVFSSDGRTLYYLSESDAGSNIFALDLSRGGVRQVSDIRTGPEPDEPEPLEGQRGFLERQQEELFEHIRLARAEEERDEARSEARAARALQPIYLERDERVRTLEIEPRGAYAVIAVGKPVEDERRTLIPDWITSSGYTQTREVRTKVGDIQSETGRIGIVSLADGSVHWLGIPAAAGDTATEFSTARFIGWNDQGTHGLVAAVDSEYENAWLWSLDAATGALIELFHDTDDAWLAGPCPFWFACAGFLPDGRTVYFASERDGFSHVYSVSVGGGQPRQLTSGKWEVQSV
ncbi:MAG: TolB family protein, partial [Longimicrobiales bacterium]